jgi:molybdate transport system substrate-binding protein
LFTRKLMFAILILALTATASTQELKVAAAADLNPTLEKLAAAFKKQTGVQLKISYGSSGHFFSEIRNGAPYDVFLSADRSYPETLDNFGKTDGESTVYALGKLVLWVASRTGLEPPFDSFNLLTSNRVNKIAIANPEHAPYGRAAVAAMSHYNVYEKIKSKLVLGENISQTTQFAESGNVDAALVSLSAAQTEGMKKSGHYMVVSLDSYPPLYQAAVVLRSSQDKANAHRFVKFLASAQAQTILAEAGFEAPGKWIGKR